MPASILLNVLLVPLLSGCVAGGVRADEASTPDAPFPLTALDVGQSMFPLRCPALGGSLVADAAASANDPPSAVQVPMSRPSKAAVDYQGIDALGCCHSFMASLKGYHSQFIRATVPSRVWHLGAPEEGL